MRKQKKYLFELIVILTVMLCFAAPVHSIDDGRELVADTTAPVISVWYGERQVFGKLGNPQKWINIMGSVSDIESEIELLTYTLNGEPGPVVLGIPGKLMVGPFPVKSDPRRLYFKGDFDIDIDKDDLKDGLNKVLITAKNKAGLESTREVIVEYQSGNTWELPYSIDWNTVDNATDVVQFVDGLWRWDKSGIRTARPAYDRLIAIGDMNWDNYEVTASVTVHYVDENGFRSPVSNQAGIGFLMRWQGHCDRPDLSIPCYQPKCGWLDLGAITWYFFRINRADYLSIWMEGDKGYTITKRAPVRIETEETFWFKSRVKTDESGHNYYLKVWEAGYKEPAEWSLKRLGEKGGLEKGSFLIILHHVDATIGNISVVPVQ